MLWFVCLGLALVWFGWLLCLFGALFACLLWIYCINCFLHVGIESLAMSLPWNKIHQYLLQTNLGVPGALLRVHCFIWDLLHRGTLAAFTVCSPLPPLSCRAVWKLQLFLCSPHNSILVPFTFKEVGAQIGQIYLDLYLNNSCCDICHFSRDMHSFLGLKTSPVLDC